MTKMAQDLIQIDMALREHFLSKTTYTPSECYSCGTCTATCPHNELKPEGQKLNVRQILHQAQIGVEPDALVWECSSCKLCEVRCPRDVDIVDNFRAIRNHFIENPRTKNGKNNVPMVFERILWSILEEANPMGEAKADRGGWMKGLDWLVDANTNQVEVLFFVGGPESYDARLQEVARAMAKIMKHANVNFGVLGKSEPYCGEAVRETGEEAFLEILVKKNVEIFNKTSAKAIIPLSPHSYDIFKRLYPEYGLDMKVIHYTEFLDVMISSGDLKFDKKLEMDVTYHDPCYLGRYSSIYEEPRNVLKATGATLIEMENNKENAICCGGGGNKIYTDIKSEERLSNVRVLEAGRTGATQMVTSCGYCIQNFEDSMKTTGTSMEVKDLSEIVAMALGVN